jgi:hypothetical protein
MPPFPRNVSSITQGVHTTTFGTTSREFSDQWRNPNDVFSVLLIVGADVVHHAIAQLAGTCLTPVAFSFGTYGNTLKNVEYGTNIMINVLKVGLRTQYRHLDPRLARKD